MTTDQAAKVVLSQTASWNPRLTNPYRTRWATRNGRYFKVHSDRHAGLWIVDEVTAAGEYIAAAGSPGIAFNLTHARRIIIEAADE